ncbi:hypothetical protein Q5752_002166 [Cryptotrichosporon argae]
MSSLKNVIVIGASVAGHELVNNLVPQLPATHRILLIERSDFAYHPIAAVRAVVEPGTETSLSTAPLTQDGVFAPSTPHRLVAPNSVVALKAGSVVLARPFEDQTEIPFDKCIIATGAQQPYPIKPKADQMLQDYLSGLRAVQEQIKAATKVLIIGGGAVGVETAGEINAAYPTKTVTLVHSDSGLLHPTADPAPATTGPTYWSSPPTAPKLSATLEKLLAERGVDVVLSDKVVFPSSPAAGEWDGATGALPGVQAIKLQSGKTVEADFVLVSIGNTPNSQIVEQADTGAIEPKSKYVTVDDYLRVVSTDAASPLKDDYFALGDVCNFPGWKTSVATSNQAGIAAANVVASIKGKALKKASQPSVVPMVIPLGKGKSGAGTLQVPLFGVISAPGLVVSMKAADFFAGRLFFGRFKGSNKPVPA